MSEIEPLTGEYLSQALDEIEDMPAPLREDFPQRCEAAVPGIVPGLWVGICGKPATAVFKYMCVHEHWKVRSTCDEHRPEPGAVGCRECWDAGHECELRAELAGRLT